MIFDFTFIIVLLGTGVLGISSGAMGTFAVLRKQSLLGDAIAHAALPGIGIAFLLTLTKSPLVLLIGAMVSGWIGTMLMMVITENTKLKQDAALGIILSVFFGFGLVLLTFIQKVPSANKSGLTQFLFGNASTLLQQDIYVMIFMALLLMLVLGLMWKEFKVMTFDKGFSKAMGIPVKRLDALLTTLIVVSIVIGLQTVGVVLMSAMLIAPAAAARQWTDKLSVMLGLSAFFGAISGIVGSFLSSSISKLPTGPVIVLVMSLIVVISLLFSPNRGLVFAWVRQKRNRRAIKADMMLLNFLLLANSHDDMTHAHDIAALEAVGSSGIDATLADLELRGLIYNKLDDCYGLTAAGLKRAHKLKGAS